MAELMADYVFIHGSLVQHGYAKGFNTHQEMFDSIGFVSLISYVYMLVLSNCDDEKTRNKFIKRCQSLEERRAPVQDDMRGAEHVLDFG